ncbi:hypothetical protein FLP41_14435 [Paracoccus marcusii]|uniref:hypothetical protein n=1 Tax=Paracoccus marcusii TaxID=59779 RepID=UPI002ED625B3|nr:hypothetical protein FLP41_14435 [Paracoccus marcusii]
MKSAGISLDASAVVRGALDLDDGRSGTLRFRLGQRQRNRGLVRIQKAVFPRDLIAVAGDHADVFDLRFKTIQFVDDLDALDLRQAEQVFVTIVKSERQLRSDIRRAARLICFLEPKQHCVLHEELHRFVAVDHMDGISAKKGIVRAFDDLLPDEIRAAAFVTPDTVAIAGQPVLPRPSDRGDDLLADFVQNGRTVASLGISMLGPRLF